MSATTTAVRATPARAWSDTALRLLRSPSGATGTAFVLALLVLAILSQAGALAFGPAAQDTAARLQAPNAVHWFGTDQFGRDIFARVASGVANSALVAIVAVAVAAIVGTLAGVVAGFVRGATDLAIGGVTNVLFAFPPLLLALTLASVLQRTWFTVAIAIAVVYTPIFVRVTRGPVLSLREADYVLAARATGMHAASIMLRHVLPNITGILIVQITLSLSWGVLTEASLSFLGLGTPPPAASLGSMIFDARTLVTVAPWTLLAPGGVLIMLVVGLNLLGDGLRDALDPTGRRAR
ncbi:ABC transporter permease [Agrococcus sp. 1P02AA]|uniref:ABC transporter permease n=1 Tax=Agrococcus sp. 1P02AA TaxID=3132259 RepID=UPI0039A55297